MDMTKLEKNKMSVGISRKTTLGRPGNGRQDGFKINNLDT
jgi:hypothetical protein